MACLKCGRETAPKEVFCAECQKVMAASPVKPDTPVVLPRRDNVEKKAPPKKQSKPEEVIGKLRKSVKRLRIAVTILSVLAAILASCLGMLAYQLWQKPDIGFNYSTVTEETGENP